MTRLQNDADEREAQRKREFLEEGAEVELTSILEYAPVAPRLSAPRPVTVELTDTGDLADRLAEDADAEAVLTLDLGHLSPTPDFSLLVFLNTPGADARSSAQEPGYLGTVGFFVGEHDHVDEPVRIRLPARRAMERSRAEGPISVTLVPVPRPGQRVTPQELDVTASVELMRSEIG